MVKKTLLEVNGQQMRVRWGDRDQYAVRVEWTESNGDSYHIETPIHPNLERDHPDKKPCNDRNDMTLDIIKEVVENVLDEYSDSDDPTLDRFTIIEKTKIRKGSPNNG